MKKVLVSGYIGFNNFGDEAIFYTLSNHLKKLGCDVSVLCSNKDIVKEKYNVKTYGFKNLFEIFIAITSCNILISGGGSLLQNKTSNFSLFYYLFIILTAKLFLKKTIIFAQGIEPINGKIQTFITKWILKTTDFISVRDENSYELLKKWNLKPNLLSDPIYSIIEDIKIKDNKEEEIIVQLRDFKNINQKFLKDLADALEENCSNKKISVFSFQDEIDEKPCKQFIELLKQKNIKANYIPNKPIKETIEIVNNSKYMISTRLHGVLISHALNVKTFALIYDKKLETFAKELNIEAINLDSYNKEELKNKIKFLLNNKNITKEYRKFDWSLIDKVLTDNRGQK